MAVEKLFEGKNIIVWHGDTNADFIKFIAKRAGYYAFNPTVNEFCMQIVGPEDAYYFARNKIIYRKDPRLGERILSPAYVIELFKQGKRVTGDCDDKTLFLATCLANMGYYVRVVGAMFLKEGSQGINHVYVEFYDPVTKNWIPLEPSTRTLGFGEKSPRVVPLIKVNLKTPGVGLEIEYGNPEKDELSISEEALWTI